MNDLLTKITDALGPVGSSALGHALIGLAILILGLFIVKFIASIIKKYLQKVEFLKKSNLALPITTMIKAVLTIFVLIAVLEHFGLSNVLGPLENMVDSFLAAVPNIIGAGVVAYAGWVIAKIVADLAGVALGKADQKLAERTGNDDIKISKFGSAFIFIIILLPIIVAALGVLNIPSVSVPASDMINKLMAAVPNIIGAGIILLVTYFIAKFIILVLAGLLEGMQVDALPAKLGIEGLFTKTFTLTRLIGAAIMFFSMLTASTAAVSTLGIDIISDIFARILDFGGGILVGSIILIIGNILGTVAYNKLSEKGNPGMANIARIAIFGLVLAMGLRAMGLADNIVNNAFSFTIGSVAIATALAFGLGGRDAAKVIADNWASKITTK